MLSKESSLTASTLIKSFSECLKSNPKFKLTIVGGGKDYNDLFVIEKILESIVLENNQKLDI